MQLQNNITSDVLKEVKAIIRIQAPSCFVNQFVVSYCREGAHRLDLRSNLSTDQNLIVADGNCTLSAVD